MILGIGTDMIEIGRIERSIEQFGSTLSRPSLHPRRDRLLPARKNMLPKAMPRASPPKSRAKALGTGISRGITWKEIEVRRKPGGSPYASSLRPRSQTRRPSGDRPSLLSLTHGRDLAMAVVIAEDQGGAADPA